MVVRMRHTRSHTRNRRSHHALSGARLSIAKESGAVHPRHKALLDGTPYKGRSVLDRTRRTKKSVAKAEAAPAPKAKGSAQKKKAKK